MTINHRGVAKYHLRNTSKTQTTSNSELIKIENKFNQHSMEKLKVLGFDFKLTVIYPSFFIF